ncbi:T9SS type A sorting domain-containing protein [Spirosoma endophyticum]|uniref:Por secretion system C-terminal sorting domain-containing protein n=1 Tax=Spirosoma endophyticum TaxID=662367 RepID=A0A1I1ULE0_9BACT|nr:T9SS type A sorting domain-containing protein [Spirosoma endophyticum]SFD71682.1 Por secretion system C-terminal sorting domain-containing protein [Spirosoma endophyticum]
MKTRFPYVRFIAHLFVISIVLIRPAASFGQIYSNTFTGTGTCPTQGNVPTTSTTATGTPLTRSTIGCTVSTGVFNSTAINNTSTINDASYIEFSVTANPGAQLNVASLSFFRQASATAPNQLEVRYSTDGFATSTSWVSAPNTPTTGTIITWDFADFTVPSTTTLTFRFYPYGTQRADLTAPASSSAGTFRLDNVTVNGTAPLPVNLVSFVGKSSNNSVVLNWVTAWEKENQGFEIQKSTNVESFEAVGFVEGNRSTQVQSVYEFTDTNVLPEQLYYYRLKQKDTGGEFAFSQITAVRAGTGEQEEKPTIFPNPSRGSFTLSGSTPDATVKLYSTAGVEIPIRVNQSGNPKRLDVAARSVLSPGLYYLNVHSADGKAKVLKVLIY